MSRILAILVMLIPLAVVYVLCGLSMGFFFATVVFLSAIVLVGLTVGCTALANYLWNG